MAFPCKTSVSGMKGGPLLLESLRANTRGEAPVFSSTSLQRLAGEAPAV